MRAREAGFGVTSDEREPPFFFLKATDSAISHASGAGGVLAVPFPPATEDLHYEAEMVRAVPPLATS